MEQQLRVYWSKENGSTKMSKIDNGNEKFMTKEMGGHEDVYYFDVMYDSKYDQVGVYYKYDHDNKQVYIMFGAPYGIGPSTLLQTITNFEVAFTKGKKVIIVQYGNSNKYVEDPIALMKIEALFKVKTLQTEKQMENYFNKVFVKGMQQYVDALAPIEAYILQPTLLVSEFFNDYSEHFEANE